MYALNQKRLRTTDGSPQQFSLRIPLCGTRYHDIALQASTRYDINDSTSKTYFQPTALEEHKVIP